jgi:hypothetical protein
MKRTRLLECVVLLLIGLWTYTAFSKLFAYPSTVLQLQHMPFIAPAAGFAGWLIPGTELIIAVLLVANNYRMAGLWASLVLISVFTFYLAFAMGSGEKLPCSCGGIISTLSWTGHLVFNTGVALLTAMTLLQQHYLFKRRQPPAVTM